jgi:CubicO group peptidase (beta-lactamase class C family)
MSGSDRSESVLIAGARRLSRRRALQGAAGLAALTAVGQRSGAAAQQATPAASPSAADDEIVRRLDEFIAQKMTSFGVPGTAVALVRGDQVLLVKGYGVRELGKSRG